MIMLTHVLPYLQQKVIGARERNECPLFFASLSAFSDLNPNRQSKSKERNDYGS